MKGTVATMLTFQSDGDQSLPWASQEEAHSRRTQNTGGCRACPAPSSGCRPLTPHWLPASLADLAPGPASSARGCLLGLQAARARERALPGDAGRGPWLGAEERRQPAIPHPRCRGPGAPSCEAPGRPSARPAELRDSRLGPRSAAPPCE